MPRIDAPDELALILEAVRGTHTRSRREQIGLYTVGCVILVGGLVLTMSTWRNSLPITSWSNALVGLLLPISSLFLAVYCYATAHVRYHIDHDHVQASAPLGWLIWTMPIAAITAIDYERGRGDARYLILHGANGTTRSLVCITSIQAALTALAKRLDPAAS